MKQTDILTGDLQLFQNFEHTCKRSNKHTKDSMNMETQEGIHRLRSGKMKIQRKLFRCCLNFRKTKISPLTNGSEQLFNSKKRSTIVIASVVLSFGL